MTQKKILSLIQKLNSANSNELLLDSIAFKQPLESKFLSVAFLNQHALNLSVGSEEFYYGLLNSDILLRDGIGVKLAQKIKRSPVGPNFNGTDLIPLILEKAKQNQNVSFFVFGTEEPWLSKGVHNLIGEHNVILKDGFLDDQEYLDVLKKNVNQDGFNLVLLAMGMPKQELLAERIKKEVEVPGLIISGGAVVDFYAQRHPRAPRWMRELSLEWFYRLLKEPRRLFKRYVIGIPKFFYYVLVNK